MFRRSLASIAAAAFLALPGVTHGSSGWTTYKDRHGYVVSYPVGWKSQVGASKQITIKSPDGSLFALVEPFKVDGQGSGEWMRENLGATFPGMQIAQSRQASDQPDTTIAGLNFRGRTGDAEASVMCAVQGSNGILYAIAAPQSQFSSRRDTLIRIVRSLHFVAPTTARHSYSARASSPVHASFRTFVDPREHAFHLQVPAGWKTTGGLYRSGVLDIRPVVESDSPEGDVRCVVGTKGISIFAEPTQMMYNLGFHEGSLYSPGSGQQEIVMHYMQGEEFAQFYIQQTLGSSVPDLQFIKSQHLNDLSALLTRIVRIGTIPGIECDGSAGYTVFKGTYKGKPYVGVCEALIGRTRSAQIEGGMWTIRGLVTAIAPASKTKLGMAVAERMSSTFAFYPSFSKMEGQAAVEVSHILVKQSEESDKAFHDMDQIITGNVEVENPETGEHSTAQMGSNYYWSNGSTIVGTNSYEAPSVDFAPLKQVWQLDGDQ